MSRSSDSFTTAVAVGVGFAVLAGGAGGVAAVAAPSKPAVAAATWQWPLHGKLDVRDRFGAPRPKGKKHQGVDLAATSGTPVYAAQAGTVTRADGNWDPKGYGNLVVVDHPGGWQTYYAHLSKFEVHKGDTVTQGQLIGEVGETGDAQGPHLHFETRKDSKVVDPQGVIGSTSSAAAVSFGALHSSYDNLFEQAGKKYGVSPLLLASVAKNESSFNPKADNGIAQGLMQLTPETAKSLGVDRWDPTQAVDGAARMLSGLTNELGSTELALSAYNAGPRDVKKCHCVLPATQQYVTKVLATERSAA